MIMVIVVMIIVMVLCGCFINIIMSRAGCFRFQAVDWRGVIDGGRK